MQESWPEVKVVPTEADPCSIAKAIEQYLVSVALEHLYSGNLASKTMKLNYLSTDGSHCFD